MSDKNVPLTVIKDQKFLVSLIHKIVPDQPLINRKEVQAIISDMCDLYNQLPTKKSYLTTNANGSL